LKCYIFLLKTVFWEQINKNKDIAINENEDKAATIEAFYRPIGFQEVEAPRFVDSWHLKVIRLSALCASCLYRQEICLVIISVRGRGNPRVLVWLKDYVDEKFHWHHWESYLRPCGL